MWFTPSIINDRFVVCNCQTFKFWLTFKDNLWRVTVLYVVCDCHLWQIYNLWQNILKILQSKFLSLKNETLGLKNLLLAICYRKCCDYKILNKKRVTESVKKYFIFFTSLWLTFMTDLWVLTDIYDKFIAYNWRLTDLSLSTGI